MKKLLFSFLAFAALSGKAQTVSNKLTFPKGKIIEVTTVMDVNTQSQMGDVPAKITMTEHYTVAEATPESVQMVKTPKRMQLAMSFMGRDIKADSDNPQDMQGQLGEPMKEMLKKKDEFTLDNTGVVTAVKGEAKKKDAQGSMMDMMVPGMNVGPVALAVGAPSVFKVLPARSVSKGDTWTDSVSTDGNKSHTVYTVKDITENEVLLDFTGDLKTKGTQSQMGMSMDVSTSGTVSGTVVLDKATGLLKQKTVTSNVDSAVNMGGSEMNATSKSTLTITVKTL